jgi:NADH:ubiquinone oxidoreductase subunit 4 (subunit M)
MRRTAVRWPQSRLAHAGLADALRDAHAGSPSPEELREAADPHFQHLPDAQGTEWVALVILVGVLVLFGVFPSLAIAPIDVSTVPLLMRLGGL